MDTMFDLQDGEIIKTTVTPIGGLEEVVSELERLQYQISVITSAYNNTKTSYEEQLPVLEEQIEALVSKAKLIPVSDDLSLECIGKLQQFNII